MMQGKTFPRRRVLGAGLAAAPLLVVRPQPAQAARVFRPEDFGARGDGRSNDTLAFAALSEAVQRAGGGVIELARRTYVVGLQRPGTRGAAAFEPAPIIALSDLPGAISIVGGGAVLRTASGLRYGSFDPRTGRALRPAMPHLRAETGASPYRAMISIERCRGQVTIEDIELDGNIGTAIIGGEWGDVGRQLAMSGMSLRDNRGGELLSRIHSHHHGLDGLMLDGAAGRGAGVRRIEGLRAEYNGRQGCSVVGGQGYEFVDCDFSHTGRAGISSPPGGGVDIESEGGKSVTGVSFRNCRFSDNFGCGLVADSGPSRGARFDDCRFVGTTNWACWPSKPGFVFNRCRFVGASVRPFASDRVDEATLFADCTFTDDPADVPGGKIYLSRDNGPIVDAGGSYYAGRNVTFRRCTMDLRRDATLPWTVGSNYEDCTMRQRSASPGYPRGVYRGTNRITGRVDLYGSRFEGEVWVNGQRAR